MALADWGRILSKAYTVTWKLIDMSREPFAAWLTCKWIGGLFYFTIGGFRGKLNNQFRAENDMRNFRAGYVITIVVVAVFVYCMFIKDHLQV